MAKGDNGSEGGIVECNKRGRGNDGDDPGRSRKMLKGFRMSISQGILLCFVCALFMLFAAVFVCNI